MTNNKLNAVDSSLLIADNNATPAADVTVRAHDVLLFCLPLHCTITCEVLQNYCALVGQFCTQTAKPSCNKLQANSAK